MKPKKFTPQDRIYRLKTRQTPLALLIDTGSAKKKPLIVWDEEKQENRAIRYAANQRTCYVDEQDGNAVLSPIIFEDGFLMVPKTKPVLQQFLQMHPRHNSLFEEVNEEANASEELELMDMQDEARQIAKDLTIDQTEMIARILMGSEVENLKSSELRRDVRLYATQNPEEFLQILDDPDIKLENVVAKALDSRYIAYRNNKRDVHWNLKENKKRLITVPKDMEPNRALVSYLLSEEGEEALTILEKLVE